MIFDRRTSDSLVRYCHNFVSSIARCPIGMQRGLDVNESVSRLPNERAMDETGEDVEMMNTEESHTKQSTVLSEHTCVSTNDVHSALAASQGREATTLVGDEQHYRRGMVTTRAPSTFTPIHQTGKASKQDCIGSVEKGSHSTVEHAFPQHPSCNQGVERAAG